MGKLPSATTLTKIQLPSPQGGGAAGPVAVGLQVNRHLVSHFFGHGGKVEFILKAIVQDATTFYEACENGDVLPTWCSSTPGVDWAKIYHKLPYSMLDGDFDVVQDRLALQ